jgi:hypothetical protein
VLYYLHLHTLLYPEYESSTFLQNCSIVKQRMQTECEIAILMAVTMEITVLWDVMQTTLSLHSSFNIYTRQQVHVKRVPCHHDVARPQVAGGGDAIQVCRVATNILNKQSRTADKG